MSYRLLDGTAAAFSQVQRLLQEGRVTFWDRWSLPRRLAERREQLNPPIMAEYIRRHIEQARTVWGIGSKLYAAPGSYSRDEMLWAETRGNFKLIPLAV